MEFVDIASFNQIHAYLINFPNIQPSYDCSLLLTPDGKATEGKVKQAMNKEALLLSKYQTALNNAKNVLAILYSAYRESEVAKHQRTKVELLNRQESEAKKDTKRRRLQEIAEERKLKKIQKCQEELKRLLPPQPQPQHPQPFIPSIQPVLPMPVQPPPLSRASSGESMQQLLGGMNIKQEDEDENYITDSDY